MINFTSNLALFRLVRLIFTDFNGFYRHGMVSLGVHEVDSTLSTDMDIFIYSIGLFSKKVLADF